MILNRRNLLPAAGLAIAGASAWTPRAWGAPTSAASLSAEIDARVQRQMARAHIPGVAVAVLEKGRPVLMKGYGFANLEWSAPVTEETAFQLASATKIFTGVALMRLVEKGRVELDAPITRHFPEAPASWNAITVRQLATHMSGLAENLGSPRPDTVGEVVAAAMARPLAYTPGAESRYGFTDFVVLRALLEKASGKSIEALLQDEVISPLGLRQTRFAHAQDNPPIRSSDVVPKRAWIYAWSDGVQRNSDFLYAETGYGAGGLYSSVADLARFFAGLADSGYLTPASVSALQSAPPLADGRPSEFGVGWTVRRYHGLRIVGHSGGPALADLLHAPDPQLTVIALTNQQRYFPLLAESIADLFLPAPPPVRPIRDHRPEVTAKMLTTLADAAAGRLSPSAFTEAGWRDSGGFLDGFGRVLLECVGPVQRADLLRSEAVPEGLRRTYRVAFEARPMTWRFTTTASGAIGELHPVGEDG